MTDITEVPEAPSKPTKPTTPKWETEARDKIKAAIKRFTGPAKALRERDANEADTRMLVTDVLVDALGYDKYADLSTEYAIRGEFADYGVRVDGQLVAMVEVKRAAQKLSEKHLRQVEAYGLREGLTWLILTNGIEWRIYHLTAQPDGGTRAVEVYRVDLLAMDKRSHDDLFLIHHDAMKRDLIEKRWAEFSAMSHEAIRKHLSSDAITDAIRLAIKRETGYRAEPADIKRIVNEVIDL